MTYKQGHDFGTRTHYGASSNSETALAEKKYDYIKNGAQIIQKSEPDDKGMIEWEAVFNQGPLEPGTTNTTYWATSDPWFSIIVSKGLKLDPENIGITVNWKEAKVENPAVVGTSTAVVSLAGKQGVDTKEELRPLLHHTTDGDTQYLRNGFYLVEQQDTDNDIHSVRIINTFGKQFSSLGAFIRQSSEIQASPSNEGSQPRQGDISFWDRYGDSFGPEGKFGVTHYWGEGHVGSDSNGASATFSVNYKNGGETAKQNAEVHMVFRTVPDPAYTGVHAEPSVAAVYKSFDHNDNFIRADVQYFEPIVVPANEEWKKKLGTDEYKDQYVKVTLNSGDGSFKETGNKTAKTKEYYVKKGTTGDEFKDRVPANDQIVPPSGKKVDKWDPALPTGATKIESEGTYTVLYTDDVAPTTDPVIVVDDPSKPTPEGYVRLTFDAKEGKFGDGADGQPVTKKYLDVKKELTGKELKDSGKLPANPTADGKTFKAWDPALPGDGDKITAEGTYGATYEVTEKDAEKYTPEVENKSIKKGDPVPAAGDMIKNKADLPSGTSFE
ncbi:Rib/alpha-like domain-containing protein, partial [Trueperella sp. LYQ143]|uniref:Rib/alpha-like domain-containing protein n=1 Tax=Trueperella sp. LYQ143 TaxID=3391059 RepID=UPI0039836865